jgi:hypothetical protein
MAVERFFIYRCGESASCAVSNTKSDAQFNSLRPTGWKFWMQVTRQQVDDERWVSASTLPSPRLAIKATISLAARPAYWLVRFLSPCARVRPMSDDNAYIFQCGGDTLFAVTNDITGANLPSAACLQGWIRRNMHHIATHPPPAPNGYYLWRDTCWAQRERSAMLPILPIEPLLPPLNLTGSTDCTARLVLGCLFERVNYITPPRPPWR